ncbi:MAG: hypothetical protein ABFD84_16865 [Candidatus Polarisedimenticolia bacterium]|nr:hypothetical protein [bacterium]
MASNGREGRNRHVEEAVTKAIERVDEFINGAKLVLPKPEHRKVCDLQLSESGGSAKTAALFFAFYALADPDWNKVQIPTGLRGEYGDKRLAAELTRRDVTIHNAITAFGENLGWKGNVENVRLSADPHFDKLAEILAKATPQEIRLVADYFAEKFAQSRRPTAPMPPVGSDVLTFARAKNLFEQLLDLPTQGHVQQFLVAAMLHVHRRRHRLEIRTHHPHGADKASGSAGDVEELSGGAVVGAYEVTVRPDWKNRLPDFKDKMDRFKLSKYIIIASKVNSDDELAVPAKLIAFLSPTGRDIAVVDIHDFAMVMAAELSASELRDVVNKAWEYLCQPDLCNRCDFQDSYRKVVNEFLDDVSAI